jgi:integrase
VHIFERAIDEGLMETNPVPSVRLLKSRRWVSHQAMTMDRWPAFLSNLMAADASPFTKGCLLLIVLTACRKTEAAGARWEEFDLDAATWTIPAERMKMRKEHFVPLPSQAVKLLRAVHEHSGGGAFVFPHYYKPNAPMHATTLGLLMRSARNEADTVHGFRSMFSTHMNGIDRDNEDIVELCLAHAPKNLVAAIYNRNKYEAERRAVLQRWANDLDAQVTKALGRTLKLDVVKTQQQLIAA